MLQHRYDRTTPTIAPVIYLLHGPDNYRVRGALAELRASLATDDGMLASNTAVLNGRDLSPQELLQHATAVPFLAEHRLVIVEGLCAAIGSAKGGRRKKPSPDDPLEPWRQVAAQLGSADTMPPTTTLVFVEGALSQANAGFAIFAPVARTTEYGPLTGGELGDWIAQAAGTRGLNLAPRAVAALAQLVGGDLWTLENELDKLAAYAQGELVEADTVTDVISAARETKIWELTDGVVAGDEEKALAAMQARVGEGDAPPMLTFMIARQFRQLVIIKDMRERGARADDVARAAGVPAFRLGAVGAIASRYSWPTLRAAYARIIDADLAVKRGLRDDETSLQLLVHELCALAPRASSSRPAARTRG